jgi:signal transduction histidine kinase
MRERVEMADGVFSVVSTPGKGTTIRAVIPVGKTKRRQ